MFASCIKQAVELKQGEGGGKGEKVKLDHSSNMDAIKKLV